MEYLEEQWQKLIGLDKSVTFGNYTIYGVTIFLGSVEGPKMKSQLFYHCEENQFLLVKNYLQSGKCHIDFLRRIDNDEKLYSPNNTHLGDDIIEIAECHYENNSKYLKWHPNKKSYILQNIQENMVYETVFYYGRATSKE